MAGQTLESQDDVGGGHTLPDSFTLSATRSIVTRHAKQFAA
jgi:hypothetical protein